MHALDWILITVLPALVIWDGVRRGSLPARDPPPGPERRAR